MGGCSLMANCPNCGKDSLIGVTGSIALRNPVWLCYNCGLYNGSDIQYLTLAELNKYRTEAGLEPLKQLPKQDFNG